MEIHDNLFDSQPVNPYYAATEKALAAQRPVQGRKKPVKRMTGFQAGPGSDRIYMVGDWMNAGQSQPMGEVLPAPMASKKKVAIG